MNKFAAWMKLGKLLEWSPAVVVAIAIEEGSDKVPVDPCCWGE